MNNENATTVEKEHILDPFFISKIHMTCLRDIHGNDACFYMESYYDVFPQFEGGTQKELQVQIENMLKMRLDDGYPRIVVVSGYDYISNRRKQACQEIQRWNSYLENGDQDSGDWETEESITLTFNLTPTPFIPKETP